MRDIPGNFFLTTDHLTPERLSWLVELLKYYCVHLYPESLHHHPKPPTPSFTFFISNDACLSFLDHRCARFWEIFFRLPLFQCILDRKEMTLSGISIESHKVKSPDQIYVADGSDNERDYFWDRVIETAEDGSRLPSIGFLQMQSPSMHRSSSLCMDLLRTAVMRSISPEWYGYLDGVHLGHQDQKPTFFSNIGMSLQSITTLAMEKGLSAQFIVCSRSATSRGYCTWRDHNGKIGSFCTVSSVKIKS